MSMRCQDVSSSGFESSSGERDSTDLVDILEVFQMLLETLSRWIQPLTRVPGFPEEA